MMRLSRKTGALLSLCAALFVQPQAKGQTTLFSDDFQTDSSPGWSVFGISANGVTNDYTAQFAFDYSTQAYRYNGVTNHVPPAPHSGGTTKGLKLTVNKDAGAPSVSAVSLYPIGKVFSNNYALKFDLWIDYSGDIPFGDGGSTEFTSFGINHAGTGVNWPAPPATGQNGDGDWFSMSADGGSGTDFRAFVGDSTPGLNLELLGTDGGFLDRDNNGTPEQNNPDGSFSPLQLLFPAPPGQTAGAPSKHWVQVEVRQQNGMISWLVDGYLIAQHANNLGGNHVFDTGTIMLGHQDPYFSELPDEPYENYAIFDNVRVVDLSTNDPLPVVSVSTPDPDATEGSDSGMFTLTRTGSATSPLTVQVRITGTASNGVDYATIPTNITFAAGDLTTNILVTPINDSVGEAVETVILSLVGKPDFYDVSVNYGIVNLTDDNDVPTASITAFRPSAYENHRAGIFNVNLSNPNSSDTTLNFTVSGTATNGVAYTNIGNSAVILAGQTVASVYIEPIDNTNRTGTRTITLKLSPGTGYSVGSVSNATENLYDDEVIQGGALFADDFETNSAVLWTVNRTTNDGVAVFSYDYSADGVPPAPHTVGNTTRGLKLQVNDTNVVVSGVTVSPSGKSFTGDYRLRFDLWINYNGPLFDGGSGSTEFANMGVGTKGITPVFAGSGAANNDAIWFGCDGDGGNGLDYRAYRGNTHLTPAGSNPGVYPAGSQAVAAPYYASFGNDPAPLAQQTGPFGGNQTGTTGTGNPGFAWHDVMVTKIGSIVTWAMDGITIATVDGSSFSFSTNVFVGYYDPSSGKSPIPDVAFALVDNLRVFTLQPPVIVSIQSVTPNAQITFTASTADSTNSFALQSAASVTGPYADVSATFSQSSPGSFQAVRPLGGSVQFYRIRRQ